MKKKLIALMLLTLSMSALSEEPQPSFNEVGLVFNNLNSFGLRYKYGNDNLKLRITSLVLNGTSTTNSYNNYSANDTPDVNIPNSTSNSIGAGLNIGLERTAQINNHFCFNYGADWVNAYTRTRSSTITPGQSTMTNTINTSTTIYTAVYNNTSNSTAWTISTGIGIVGGLTYKLNEMFSISAELEPTISYKYTETTTSTTNYGIIWIKNINGAPLTPSQYVSSSISQTTVNKGFTGSLANTGAGIVIAIKVKGPSKKIKYEVPFSE